MKKFLLSTFAFAMTINFATAEKNDYFEGFESWDSRTDWLPEGWTEQNTDENIFMLNDGAFTWHVSNKEGTLPNPPEGNCYAVVYYAYETDENGNKTDDLAQDEWMISPAIAVSENSILSFYAGYSPLFLFDLNDENIDWGAMDFKTRKPSTTLKIHVRSNGGEWEMLKDMYDEWVETPFEDLFNNYFNTEFRKYSFDLSEYAGTEVEVAFQFVGKYGNTMEIDSFKVSNLQLSVDNVEEDRIRPSVFVSGNNFVIDSQSATCVDIYSANAGLIESVAIDGKTMISNTDLPSGIYLFRFSDGTVVKVIK